VGGAIAEKVLLSLGLIAREEIRVEGDGGDRREADCEYRDSILDGLTVLNPLDIIIIYISGLVKFKIDNVSTCSKISQ